MHKLTHKPTHKLAEAEQLSVLTGGSPLNLRRSHFRQNCAASVSSVFRGIFGFILARAGFVPGKTKKGEKHRKGTLTDDRCSASGSLKKEMPLDCTVSLHRF